MTKTQWIAITVGLIIAGVGGFGLGHWGPSAAVRQIGQYDVMESYAIINQANHELALHHQANAESSASVATGWLSSATMPLQLLGVGSGLTGGASELINYLQAAEFDFVGGTATTHQRAVLNVFHQALAPFGHEGFGQIPESAFRAALNRVATEMAK